MSKFSVFVIGLIDILASFLSKCFSVYPVESFIFLIIFLIVLWNGLINIGYNRTFFRGIKKEY